LIKTTITEYSDYKLNHCQPHTTNHLEVFTVQATSFSSGFEPSSGLIHEQR